MFATNFYKSYNFYKGFLLLLVRKKIFEISINILKEDILLYGGSISSCKEQHSSNRILGTNTRKREKERS